MPSSHKKMTTIAPETGSEKLQSTTKKGKPRRALGGSSNQSYVRKILQAVGGGELSISQDAVFVADRLVSQLQDRIIKRATDRADRDAARTLKTKHTKAALACLAHGGEVYDLANVAAQKALEKFAR